MRNHKAIRRNIRQAWNRGDSNRRHRGAWGNGFEVFRLPPPGPSYPEGVWRFFGARYDNISLTVAETYIETRTYTLTYDGGIFPDFTSTQTEDMTYDFTASVTRPDIKTLSVANPLTTPPQARIIHASACPYGEGLYDCRGSIIVLGDTHYVSNPSDTDPPPVTSVDIYGTASISLDYESDETAINGRLTPCLVVAGQQFSGPLVMYQPFVVGPEQPFLPYPEDEYGVTLPDGTSVEKYYSETFLNDLLNGTFSAVSVRNSGSLTDFASFPDPSDDPLNTYSASHSWARTGSFDLTLS